eukprot:9181765-Ditylum_brightwellii.AAC.1
MAASVQSLCGGHICIYDILNLFRTNMQNNMYDKLMMLNKFEKKVLMQVTVVPSFEANEIKEGA